MNDEKKYDQFPVVTQEQVSLGRFTIYLETIENGYGKYPFSYLKVKNSVSILPIVNGKILLIRQYRHALGTWEYEIPGGGLEPGEKACEGAIRELREETGYVADSVEELGVYYPSPGLMNEKAHLFLCHCHSGECANREPLELVTNELVTWKDFRKMISSGVFKHGMGLAAWCKYMLSEHYNGEIRE